MSVQSLMEASDASTSHEEEARRFDPSVGSSSNYRDLIEGLSVASDLDRYNSFMDGRD